MVYLVCIKCFIIIFEEFRFKFSFTSSPFPLHICVYLLYFKWSLYLFAFILSQFFDIYKTNHIDLNSKNTDFAALYKQKHKIFAIPSAVSIFAVFRILWIFFLNLFALVFLINFRFDFIWLIDLLVSNPICLFDHFAFFFKHIFHFIFP